MGAVGNQPNAAGDPQITDTLSNLISFSHEEEVACCVLKVFFLVLSYITQKEAKNVDLF